MNHRGGILAVAAAHDLDAGARRPGLELLGRGGAKRVGGHQQRATALAVAKCAASLPASVVLPTPLTPTISATQGRGRSARARQPRRRPCRLPRAIMRAGLEPRGARPSRDSDFGFERFAQRHALLAQASLGAGQQLLRRRRADVGEDQRVFERLPRLGIHRAAAAERRLEAACQALARAIEPAADAAPECHGGALVGRAQPAVTPASSGASARSTRFEASWPSNLTDTSFEMPSSCMVTP